jgi:2-polyprenyl-3-methyl-5-hydroxy-6-metoxy-1,4-benzoquinol methylase
MISASKDRRIGGRRTVELRTLFTLALLICAGLAVAATKDKERWDAKYATDEYILGKAPIAFLEANVHLLPKGKALDLAMGEGRNGVFLATAGFQVTGLDISEKGLEKARKLAAERNVAIETKVVDLESHRLEPNAYDVVLCIYYLQRDLIPQIKQAVKPGGMVVIETYNLDYLKYNSRFNRQYLIESNELLDWFKDFKVIRYQTVDDGKTAFSSILAQKP